MAENRIRIREAVAHAKSQGRKVKKPEFAMKVFPGASTVKSAHTNLNYFESGVHKKMDKLQIVAICDYLGVDSNFLFGTPPMKPPEYNDLMERNAIRSVHSRQQHCLCWYLRSESSQME